jgi:hypothetical protein
MTNLVIRYVLILVIAFILTAIADKKFNFM